MIPQVVNACNDVSTAADRGAFGTAVVEFSGGLLLITEITGDAILAIAFQPGTNVGSVLFELQRHRSSIAGLL